MTWLPLVPSVIWLPPVPSVIWLPLVPSVIWLPLVPSVTWLPLVPSVIWPSLVPLASAIGYYCVPRGTLFCCTVLLVMANGTDAQHAMAIGPGLSSGRLAGGDGDRAAEISVDERFEKVLG